MKTRNTHRTQQAAYTHVHTHLEQLVQVWRREGDAPKHQGVLTTTFQLDENAQYTQRTQQAAYTHVHTHLEQLVQVWRREGDAPKHQGVQACTQSVHVGGSASISRIGLHHLRCEEGRGAVAALKILISGGEDLRTAEDIPMCLHSCVCVCVCWASSIWG